MLPPRTRGAATLEDGCVRARLEGTVSACAAFWSASGGHGELVADIVGIVDGLRG